MDDVDRDRLAVYLRDLADRMGLKDWSIEVLTEWAGDGAHAEVKCVNGQKRAKVRFDRDWRDQTPEVLRHTCCHELVHCHLAPLLAEADRRLSGVNVATFEMLLEYGVDGIADAWAPSLPLMLDVQTTKDTRMGRQRPVKADTAEPKPKARPKGTATPKGKTPKKG